METLGLDKDYRKGMKGNKVQLIQEWLSLNGIGVVPDRDFGAATDLAVREFQRKVRLDDDGIVGQDTFAALVRPMQSVLEELPPVQVLGHMVAAYAKLHLKSSPREIGGQNKGPWVRLYMDGKEGENWPWCAGFACFVLKQACRTMGVPLPITTSVSCDSLAASAKEKGLFMAGAGLDRQKVRPGMFFLNRRTPTDWTHVGIVIKTDKDVFMTIEGNTNDEGSREGYEVCRRVRNFSKKDFIRI